MFKKSNGNVQTEESTAATSTGPITLTLGGNHLKMKENGKWTIESSDLDLATFEIEKLVEDKETLTNSLSAALDQIDQLGVEVKELSDTKVKLLEMLMSERQKRMQVEYEMQGYRDELKESFCVIVELRKLIPKDDDPTLI